MAANSDDDQWSDFEITVASFNLVIASIQIIKFYGLLNDSLDKWEETNDLLLDLQDQLSECYCRITFPLQVKAIESACNVDLPAPDCSEAAFWRGCTSEMMPRYMEAEQCYREDSCVTDADPCNSQWQMTREAATANATHALWAADRIRHSRCLVDQVEGLRAANAIADIDAGPITSLLSNALGKADTLISAGTSGVNSGFTSLIFGLQQLGNAGLFGSD